jgi:excisionase family DNA binding protein
MPRRRQDRPLELATCGPAQAAEAIGVGKTRMYELIKDGTIPHVLVGGFIRVPWEALQHWADQVAHSASAGPVAGIRWCVDDDGLRKKKRRTGPRIPSGA